MFNSRQLFWARIRIAATNAGKMRIAYFAEKRIIHATNVNA